MTDHVPQGGYIVPNLRHESAAAECNRLREEVASLRQSLREARELIEELAGSPVEFEDFRIRYKTLQVSVVAIDMAKKWLEENGDE